MKLFVRIIVVLMAFRGVACTDTHQKVYDLNYALNSGDFNQAELWLGDQLKLKSVDEEIKKKYVIELETLVRLRKEFPLKREDVIKQLEDYFPGISHQQLDKWEQAGQLEMRIIDGEKRYFKRSVSNFFRLNKEAGEIKTAKDGESYDGVEEFQHLVIPAYFLKQPEAGKAFDHRKIEVSYIVRLKPNQVPEGKMVKCWLPYPRAGLDRLSMVKLLETSQDDYIIAPPEKMQRTIYMEKPAIQDEETIFSVSYTIHTAAQWFNIKEEQVEPYDKTSPLYKKYTSERLPNIVLNEKVKKLARDIVNTETNPVEQVRLLYYWLNNNIPWSGALEYSVMSCIPEYVLDNMRGDCGMQTFLFLSLARSLGIPCKWQSGWYLLPQEKNLHDWAEVYYEGVGWVPVDPSFKLINSEDIRVMEFYLNGLDSYRLVVNDDYAQELYPEKQYYRSEPFDFQRGELEWEGGNLYFDTWSYKMEVKYLDKRSPSTDG